MAIHAGKLQLRAAEPPLKSGRALLLLRPEKLTFSPHKGNGKLNRFAGMIKDVVFQGESVLVTVVLDGGHEIHTRVRTGTWSAAPCLPWEVPSNLASLLRIH